MNSYQRVWKPLFDRLAAAVGLIVGAPILVVLAVLVRLRLGTPILFTQVRPGQHGENFTLYKFRTMLEANDEHGRPLPDEHRLTSVGRLIRSTSLDELPELWNVLKGDMALVGPRPLLVDYLERYTPEQARRHEVRPGITGWAQIRGRNAASWEEQLALDVWYVDNQSFWLDLRILVATIPAICLRKGISQPGQATRERFAGGDPTAASAHRQAGAASKSDDTPTI